MQEGTWLLIVCVCVCMRDYLCVFGGSFWSIRAIWWAMINWKAMFMVLKYILIIINTIFLEKKDERGKVASDFSVVEGN